MKRFSGQAAMSVTIGCWSVALWAVFVGTGHAVQVGHDLLWWPGSTTALLVAIVAYMLLAALPAVADPLHRAAGRDGTGTWALFAAIALLVMVVILWGAVLHLLAGLELFALGMASLWAAGLTAPTPVPDADLSLPALAAGSAEPGEAEEREIVWAERSGGWVQVEPYVLRARVERAGLLSQRQSAHDLPEHRWGEYAAVTPTIRALAQDVRAIAQRGGLDPLDEARIVASLVTTGLGPAEAGAPDTPAFPLETLTNPALAGPAARMILAGAILAALGYRPALLKAGSRIALALTGPCPLPGLFLTVGGAPAIFIDSTRCGDAPADVRAIPWMVLPIV